jgi:hypothetical protein
LIGGGLFTGFVVFLGFLIGRPQSPGTTTFIVCWLFLSVILFALAMVFTPGPRSRGSGARAPAAPKTEDR